VLARPGQVPLSEGMAPKRPRSHVLGEEGEASAAKAFRSQGWTVEKLSRDYGEDLLVRIFENGEATPYTFYVQVKSDSNLARRMVSNGAFLSYPIRFSHLQSWEKFWEPVIFAVWDPVHAVTYWEMIQSPERPIRRSQTGARIYTPTDNTLDAEGLARIDARTRSRYEQLEREQHGAQALITMLESLLDVRIGYYPQNGLLMVEEPSARLRVTVFGRIKERLERLEELSGQPLETMANEMLRGFADKLESPGPFETYDAAGNVQHVETAAEFCAI
jgi:Domain of unknown function (DUF4365)